MRLVFTSMLSAVHRDVDVLGKAVDDTEPPFDKDVPPFSSN
jgi:hypothetical protein